MKFGLDMPTTGEFADARVLAELAAEAEAAGWDGFFLWDTLLGGGDQPEPTLDPWIALTALALNTRLIRLGLTVLALPRHRPWLVARRLANLDQLSGGRMICAVGLGHSDRDFAALGEESALPARAAKLDEGLAVLAGLWSGEPFTFAGAHYTLTDVTLLPRPIQSPRIPLWVAGGWPRRGPFRRAARWDGALVKSIHHETRRWLALDDFRDCVTFLRERRGTQDGAFDIVASGEAPDDPAEARAKMAALEEAGATWWTEEGLGWSLDELRQRIRIGPPRG
ncbi:MAG TPA: LLM class flavin-dependent oxidoreductase [Ktedonobacterales bacterium]|nr:LLM class flavin-dependent oxidoreductase [Ktedonobacterales bacterium]